MKGILYLCVVRAASMEDQLLVEEDIRKDLNASSIYSPSSHNNPPA